MRIAFKEWAVVVDALSRGTQVLILRKGGIAEGSGGFQPEHERFWLFPTQFHQQRDAVLPAAQSRYDEIAPHFPEASVVRLTHFAQVTTAHRLESLEAAQRLRPMHIWSDEVIAQRFDWGADRGIHALLVRVFQIPAPVELPMAAAYGGCKSWVTLERDVDTGGAVPVLEEKAFAAQCAKAHEALTQVGAP